MSEATETRTVGEAHSSAPCGQVHGLVRPAARPILFSGPMVRAILAGLKTQTRRIVKPQPEMIFDGESLPDGSTYGGWEPDMPPWSRWPYQIGMHLWVRETWQEFFADELPIERRQGRPGRMGIPAQAGRKAVVAYRADGELAAHPEHGPAVWRPSIHMPRWASRITLEITGVRVERLQKISDADSHAEGCATPATAARSHFRNLWESINGPGSWDANPWVWALEFRRVD